MARAHAGHFTQRPSGTRLTFSGAASMGLRAFLNQAMGVQCTTGGASGYLVIGYLLSRLGYRVIAI
jgi:hypothetical protein